MEKIEKNGLALDTIKSTSKVIDINTEDEKILKENFTESGIIIIYLDYRVIIRKFENGKIIFMVGENAESRFIQKLRLFNPKQELYIWRTEGKLKGRIRKDNEGDTIDIIDANQVLFGTTGERTNGYSKLTEERGTEIILPLEVPNIDAKENRVKIKTRNYIKYNELGQAGYYECRFVELTFGKENKSIGG